MKTYDLYGTSELTPIQLKDILAGLLGVEFRERDSSYRGVYYRAGDLHDEHFVIQVNEANDPEDLPEPSFADKRVLLEVNATLRPEALRHRLANISELVLLRTKVI